MYHIKGLKISGELCLMRLRRNPGTGTAAGLLQSWPAARSICRFYQRRIKQTVIHAPAVWMQSKSIDKKTDDAEPTMLKPTCLILRGLGLLTLFPHQSSLTIVRPVAARTGAGRTAGFRAGVLHRRIDLCSRLCQSSIKAAAVMQACFKLPETMRLSG
jgi:hypothetical protein